jgi:hypothetical protein
VQRALVAIDAGIAQAINANPPGSGG